MDAQEQVQNVFAYYGVADLDGLMKTTEWSQLYNHNFEMYGGDERKARAATLSGLTILKEKGAANAFFVGSGKAGKGDDQWEGTRVLFPDGSTNVVGEPLNLDLHAPVQVHGVTLERNVGLKTTRQYWARGEGKDLRVTPGGHDEAPPIVTLTSGLEDARSPNKYGKNKGRITGKAYGVYAVGHVAVTEERGIYIGREGDWNEGATIPCIDDDDNQFDLFVTPDALQEALGFNIYEDMEGAKQTLANEIGRVVFVGDLDVTAKIKDDHELASEFASAWRQNSRGGNLAGNPEVGPHIILNAYVGDDSGLNVYVDCDSLGYRPRVNVGEVKKRTFTAHEGTRVWFPDYDGTRGVSRAAEDLLDAAQRKIEA